MSIKKWHSTLADCIIGIVGINHSSLRLARLLNKLGCSKILGTDEDEKRLFNFEKVNGIATPIDTIVENADIVIFMKESLVRTEFFYKLNKGQIIMVHPNMDLDMLVLQERGVKECVHLNMGNTYLLVPGLIEKMILEGVMRVSDDMLLVLANKIVEGMIDIDSVENMNYIKKILSEN